MKKLFPAIALLLVCLLVSGCTITISQPTDAPASVPTETKPAATEPEATKPTATEPELDPALSLVPFRQALVGTPQVFAVAYFGYADLSSPADADRHLKEASPLLCSDLPFLLSVPEENIIGQTGELYCIVPAEENAHITIKKDEGDGLYGKVIYEGIGDPVLLLCNDDDNAPNMEVTISPSADPTVTEGRVTWYPMLDDNGVVDMLRDEEGMEQLFDFSPYQDMLAREYADLKSSGWSVPTRDMLVGTSWFMSANLRDGGAVDQTITFREGVCDITWTDGYSDEEHQYRDAGWTLSDDGIFVIDLGGFAGELSYRILYEETTDLLYFQKDTENFTFVGGYDPLQRDMIHWFR